MDQAAITKLTQSAEDKVVSCAYDARRLRTQREVVRDVMLAAADSDTWLTLDELRALTRYCEASISAQLRHLRKPENGGYEVEKRIREGSVRPSAGGFRPQWCWEYFLTKEKTQPEAQ